MNRNSQLSGLGQSRVMAIGIKTLLLILALAFSLSVSARIGITNLELASFNSWSAGDLTVIGINELQQGGTDLNGDGDGEDDLYFLYDQRDEEFQLLPISGRVWGLALELVVFEKWEFQDQADWNSDGDILDRVLHVYDIESGAVTNIGYHSTVSVVKEDGVLFRVPEYGQGQADLNEDGDSWDAWVWHWYDFETGLVRNLKKNGSSASLFDGVITLAVSELTQGNSDLNGDGDTWDTVMHLYDLESGNWTNLGLAADQATVKDGIAIVPVLEFWQGTDLNSDGDMGDHVLHYHDLASSTTVNLGLSSRSGQVAGNVIVFATKESHQGFTDLNGDGDHYDSVLHTHDLETGITDNLQLAISYFGADVFGTRWAFAVDEYHEAKTDLNGDGDDRDHVVHLYDWTDGAITNLSIPTSGGGGNFRVAGQWLVVNALESGPGQDLNGDGDFYGDIVPHLVQVDSLQVENLGYVMSGLEIAGDLALFAVREINQGRTDFNGDGDYGDQVAFYKDLNSGLVVNLGLAAGSTFHMNNGQAVFSVRESGQGETDLNGDRDILDRVLHDIDLVSAAVPDLLMHLADQVEAYGFDRGISEKLGANLQLALAMFSDEVDQNDQNGVLALKLFIQNIEMHRENGIPSVEADPLILIAIEILARI
jgi:hypothetical protein